MMDHIEIASLSFMYLLWCSVVSFWVLEDWEEEEEGTDVEIIAEAVAAFRRIRKRAFEDDDDDHDSPDISPKRTKYDYERAHRCIQQDYLGPDPQCGRQFERIFRVTRGIVEQLIQVCGNSDPFFTHRDLVTKEPGIWPEAKVLMALKTLGYGCSSSAFVDHFQMGITSGKDTLKKFCNVIAKSSLKDEYLRKMTRADARKVSALHKREFGVAGCIGCLDCMHVCWKNCPVAWQGQYQGKEGSASTVVEGPSDYNAWSWNLKFGFPGTLNDINIWERSSLLKAFLDGTFSEEIDFKFNIGDLTFDQLCMLVDGIYPELSRFVKTFSVPLSTPEKDFSEWQEASRKSVERAFGIAQRKFQTLCRPAELWHEDDISDAVTTCFILHDMMVEVRLGRDEEERVDWWDLVEEDDGMTDDEDETVDSGDEMIPRHQIDIDDGNLRAEKPKLETRMKRIRDMWPCACPERDAAAKEAIGEHFDSVKLEWRNLCDAGEHLQLRQAIMDELQRQKKEEQRKKKDKWTITSIEL